MPLLTPVTSFDIAVTRVFKGGDARRIRLTHFGCCICEEPLEAGKEYLLFVFQHGALEDAYMASICHPNAPVADAAASLRELGVPQRVYKDISRRRTPVRFVADAAHYLANWAASAYFARVLHNPYIRDPVAKITGSPWFRFNLVILAGVPLGLLAVFGRRKRQRRRSNSG